MVLTIKLSPQGGAFSGHSLNQKLKSPSITIFALSIGSSLHILNIGNSCNQKEEEKKNVREKSIIQERFWLPVFAILI